MTKLTSVLFDLDGTLVDTAPDMAEALNTLLREENRTPLSHSDIRPQVSKGALALVTLGFGHNNDTDRLQTLRERFLNVYSKSVCIHSGLFPGLATLLDELDGMNISWGVVTNKPGWLTEPLLKQLNLYHRCACIVSGDTLPQRKPDPAPLLHACKQLQRNPAECVYVGDDERDVIAGKAAGMRTLIAGYGYIGSGETPQHWGADDMIEDVGQLRAWLKKHLISETA